jgi:hypothetical protein
MIQLTRVGEDERVPGIKCNLCGAVVTFDTTLRDDQALTNDDHEEMRAEAGERFGWRHLINATQIGPSELDLCSRCTERKLEAIPHS